jgi:hypothetical protein
MTKTIRKKAPPAYVSQNHKKQHKKFLEVIRKGVAKRKQLRTVIHFVIRPGQKGVEEEMLITNGSEAHTLVKDYCETNGYEYKEGAPAHIGSAVETEHTEFGTIDGAGMPVCIDFNEEAF